VTSLLLPKLTAAATEAVRDDFGGRLNEASAWVEWLQAGAPNAGGCVVCGSLGLTEAHHIAGRQNSDLRVPVCIPHHRKLTERQNRWDPRWVLPDNSPALRESLIVRGMSDLCEEKGRFDGAYHELGLRLAARYALLGKKTLSEGAAS
jgi:hypothetical protein